MPHISPQKSGCRSLYRPSAESQLDSAQWCLLCQHLSSSLTALHAERKEGQPFGHVPKVLTDRTECPSLRGRWINKSTVQVSSVHVVILANALLRSRFRRSGVLPEYSAASGTTVYENDTRMYNKHIKMYHGKLCVEPARDASEHVRVWPIKLSESCVT
jgi:hypothetical protein